MGIKNTGAPDLKVDPATEYQPIVKSADPIDGGEVRGLLVATAGTANLTQLDGTERDGVPLVVGYNMIAASHVREGGTADGIWGLR